MGIKSNSLSGSATFCLGLLASISVCLSQAAVQNAPEDSVGRFEQNKVVTPVNQVITPVGTQIDLPGLRPQALALSPNGKLLATSGKTAELILIDPQTGGV